MDITIEKLIYGGEGLGHHDGSTVFVPFVLARRARRRRACRAEEEIRSRARRTRSRAFARAHRAALPAFRHLRRMRLPAHAVRSAAQLQSRNSSRDARPHRTNRLDGRNHRARIAALGLSQSRAVESRGRSRAGTAAEKLAIGYFRASSTALCAVEDCQILSPLLLKTLLALRAALAAGPIAARTARDRSVRRSQRFEAAPHRHVRQIPEKADEAAKAFREIVPEIESLLFHDPGRDRMELDGPGFLEYQSGRDDLSRRPLLVLSGESFSFGRSGSRGRGERRGEAGA